MIKVKICGITNLEDALMVSDQGVDIIGFIFTQKSPRYIDPKEAAKIVKQLDPFVFKAGVFMGEKEEAVRDIAQLLRLDILQFHSDESAVYCQKFLSDYKVIKVLFPDQEPYLKKINRFKVNAYLLDLKLADKKDGIKVLPPETLDQAEILIKEGHKIIISSGLNPDNLAEVVKLKPCAVDVASGVEKMVGKKDKDMVKRFIKNTKK